MGWEDVQEEVLKRLTPEQLGWLKKSVDLEVSDLREMSTKEIRKRFPGDPEGPEISTVDDARLIRTFIWQSYLMIKAGELSPVKGNLRSFWYRDLRPFYKNHNLLESDEGPALFLGVSYGMEDILEALSGGGERRMDLFGLFDTISFGAGREFYLTDKMGKSFDQFVLRAFFRFKGEFEFQDPREAFRIIGRKRPRLIFFTEKEGLFWLCEEIARKYGISAMASHGEPGYLTLEYFSDDLKDHDVRNVEIAALTDYDPWGYNIAREFGRKFQEPVFGFGVKTTHLTSLDLFKPEVIEYAKRDLRKVSPSKRKQVEEWMKETGGIGGEPYGMHVDHAEFPRIRAAVEKWYKGVSGGAKRRRR